MLLAKAYRPDPRVYKEATTLSKHGFSVFVLSWDRACGYPRYRNDGEAQIFHFRFLKAKKYNVLIFSLGILLFNIVSTLWALTKRIDYVHANDFDTLPAGFVISRIKHVRLVYDSHESYVDAIAPYVPRVVATLIGLAESALVRHVDYVITENERKKKILTRRGASKVYLLPNYPRVSLFRNVDRASAKRGLGLGDKFVVLYIGEVMPGRNLEKLIDLALLLRGSGIDTIVFLVVGAGSLLPKLKQMATVNDLAKYFHFIDWVSPLEVPMYYAASDVVYILLENQPINRISLPNKMFEAIASGNVVLASKFGEVKKVIETTGCGVLCDSEDTDAILRAILLLKNNPDQIEKIRQNTYTVREQFSWESVENTLLDVYIQ